MSAEVGKVRETNSVNLVKRSRKFAEADLLPIVNEVLPNNYLVRRVLAPNLFSPQVVACCFAVVRKGILSPLRYGVLRFIVGSCNCTLVIYSADLQKDSVRANLRQQVAKFAEEHRLIPELEIFID